jgi:hypothetical protein
MSKIMEHLHETLFLEGFSNRIKSAPNFLIFLEFIEISMTKLFDIQ